MPRFDWGLREDKTQKGPGYFGVIPRPDKGISTELSIGIELDGKEVQIPLLVPGLTKAEIQHLTKGGKPTKEIVDKAVAHAKQRLQLGKSPFETEQEYEAHTPIQRSWLSD